MTTTGAPQHGIQASAHNRRNLPRRRWLISGGCVLLAGLMLAIWLIGQNWPYRYRKIKPLLEETFGCQVTIGHYERTYFPNPGFVARGLILRRKTALNQPPVATIAEMYVQSHWIDLFTLRKRIHLFQLVHVHVLLPPTNSPASRQAFPPGSSSDFDGPDTPIQDFEVRDGVLEILRENGGSFVFPINELHIEDMQAGHEWTYALAMRNAIPTGDISASGRFGPLVKNNPGATPVSGRFRFTRVNLHDLGKVGGTLSAFGTFHGPLQMLDTQATAAAPDFSVDDGHPTPIAGDVRCGVNGLNGDVFFHSLELRTGNTLVHAQGQVAGSPHATNLDIAVDRGRAEDLMRPFLHHPVPITGPVKLHAHAYLAPTREGDFLHRLKLDGAFDVPEEKLTDTKTEKSLTDFSHRAQDDDHWDASKAGPDTYVLSSVSGPVQVRDAVASSPRVTFVVAGASAVLHGTFNFHNSAAHLTGDLRMEADISHTASGFKAVLLKPLAPFFKKKKAGAVVPIAVTGTPGHYQVQQNITHSK